MAKMTINGVDEKSKLLQNMMTSLWSEQQMEFQEKLHEAAGKMLTLKPGEKMTFVVPALIVEIEG